jgi:hypothetical protein
MEKNVKQIRKKSPIEGEFKKADKALFGNPAAMLFMDFSHGLFALATNVARLTLFLFRRRTFVLF